MDASPRGGAPGFVKVHDERTRDIGMSTRRSVGARGRKSATIVLFAACCLGLVGSAGMAQPETPSLQEPGEVTRTSLGEIQKALKLGEIDEEQALVYRVWSLFGDERLPERFRAPALGEGHSAPLQEVIDRFSELSPWAQDQILPFLRR